MTRHNDDLLPAPTDDDIRRVRATLRRIGGSDVVWGAAHVYEVLQLEHRMRAERMATKRIALISWVLAGATVVLALATIALIFATLRSK